MFYCLIEYNATINTKDQKNIVCVKPFLDQELKLLIFFLNCNENS